MSKIVSKLCFRQTGDAVVVQSVYINNQRSTLVLTPIEAVVPSTIATVKSGIVGWCAVVVCCALVQGACPSSTAS